MKRTSTILGVAKADFRDRSRGYVFLVTLAATLYMGYLFVPRVGETFYYTLTAGMYRGYYNAAWVGTSAAMAGVSLMMLFGFYLIKNAVKRDESYRVGELIAATPLSKFDYIAGKFLSNLFYLGTIIIALMIMSFVMLLLRGEDPHFDIMSLVQPYFYIALPPIVFFAACAVFFEVTPWLRGGLGNVIYFIVVLTSLPLMVENKTGLDLMGIELVETHLKADIVKAIPEYTGGFSLGHMGQPMPEGSFFWSGIDWAGPMVARRFFWIGFALALVIIAVPVFSRFDPSMRARQKTGDRRGRTAPLTAGTRTGVALVLSPLNSILEVFRVGRMIAAEIRIALIGLPAIWYLVAAGLWLATLLSPIEAARQHIMPFVWIWPILIWSQLGVREQRHRVDQVMYSMPDPGLWQPIAAWSAGVVVALLTASGLLIRGVVQAEWGLVGALLAGSFFVPSLALAAGVISKSSRLFEITYLMLWYIGPMNQTYELDYLGSFRQTIENGIPLYYGTFAVGLLLLALFVRGRQVRN